MKHPRRSRSLQGQGTTLLGKLFLTPAQRLTLLKWVVFSLAFLVLQIFQDVLFSRIRIFGGCPDVVPVYLLLLCLTVKADAGALFLLIGCTLRCLWGMTLGPVSMLLLVFMGVGLHSLRDRGLWGQVRSTILCTILGIGLHNGLLFCLGVFLNHTTWDRYMSLLGGLLGCLLAIIPLYPLVRVIGKIGGNQWKE